MDTENVSKESEVKTGNSRKRKSQEIQSGSGKSKKAKNSKRKKLKKKKHQEEQQTDPSGATDEARDRHRNDEIEADNTEDDEKDRKKTKAPSKRQLKRARAAEREQKKKEASKTEAKQKALEYVSKWKHTRSTWKFEKFRQIWLMDNLLDDNSIPDSIFPIVLEYFEGCKGMAREQLLKKGMDVIKKVEENKEDKDAIQSLEYKRARQLLQALPSEV